MSFINPVRTAVRVALENAPALSAAQSHRTWVQNPDETHLPGYTVRVPSVPAARSDQTAHQRDIDLVVDFRRIGDEDLEDLLADDAAAIEPVVMAELETLRLADTVFDYDVAGYEFDYDGGGARRVGRVLVRFTCTVFTDF